MSTTHHPVDSSHVTQGAGIPDDALDALIAATVPAADDSAENLSEVDATMPAMTNTLTNTAPSPTDIWTDLPAPADATRVYPLEIDGDGAYRPFGGASRKVGGMLIGVEGEQYRDGRTARRAVLAPTDGAEVVLDPAGLRELAEQLVAAADELDALKSAEPGMVTLYNTATNTETIVPIERVAETVRPWFPNASDAVREAIAELQQTLDMGRCPDGLTAFLGITIDGDRYDRQRRAEIAALEVVEVAR